MWQILLVFFRHVQRQFGGIFSAYLRHVHKQCMTWCFVLMAEKAYRQNSKLGSN